MSIETSFPNFDMKKLFFLALACGMALSASAQITFFEGTWADVKAKAKKENKMIFVDAYTVWCGPCKWMSANTFKDKNVGEFYNTNFVNYKFDMEKGEGPTFANEFSINAYPTLLYFHADGTVAHRTEGSEDATAFLEHGKTVLNGGGTVAPLTEADTWESLNEKAWHAYENDTERGKLEEALQWAMESIEMDKNFYNTDTYAHLAYKLGKKQDALKWALISVELGKKDGQDVSSTEALVKKIKSGQ